MKKNIFIFLFLLIIILSIGGYLFLKSEQKRMFEIYFLNKPFNILYFYDKEFLPFHKQFYATLNIKKSDNELKTKHICLFKDEIFKANKKLFVFNQKQLEKTLNKHCDQSKVFLNDEVHYIHLYNICNLNKNCEEIVLYLDGTCFLKNKTAYQLTGNKLEQIDFKTTLNQKLNIKNSKKILFSFISDTGIGNQLFQHWGAYVYAQKKDLTLFPIRKKQIHSIFELQQPNEIMQKIKEIGSSFEYDKRIIDFEEDIFIFKSNPISAKNLIGYENFIQENTKFKNELTGKSKEIATQMQNEISVSIHIRRGDFVKIKCRLLELSYYQKAIQYMKEKFKNPHFYVFSDDIQWAKENLKTNADVTFVDWTTSAEEDLHLMTKTNHNIIANSSFSWWGAFLNKNKEKIVIIPSTGFYNEGYEHMKVDDNWIVIEE